MELLPTLPSPKTLFVWQEHKSPAMSVNTSMNMIFS
jgi:hypothetical protein